MANFRNRYNDRCFGCGRTDEIYGVGARIDGRSRRFTTLCKPCIEALGAEIQRFLKEEE